MDFLGTRLRSERSTRSGFVRSVHAEDELLPAAKALAMEFSEMTSAVSVTLIRHMLWKMLGADHPMEAHKIDSRGVYYRGRSADAFEGVESFLQKRAPSFPGKVSKDLPEFFPWWDEPTFE